MSLLDFLPAPEPFDSEWAETVLPAGARPIDPQRPFMGCTVHGGRNFQPGCPGCPDTSPVPEEAGGGSVDDIACARCTRRVLVPGVLCPTHFWAGTEVDRDQTRELLT
jgi:hypothetical protein